MSELRGRTALITGASSGLGARFARILASAGANVVLAARRVDRLELLCAQIEAEGGRAAAVSLDVADERSVVEAYDAAERAFGVVDTIIANAGVNMEGPVLQLEAGAFDNVIAVNVRGCFLTVREGARRLVACGSRPRGARVVIISSVTANTVSPGLAVYSASKAAVQQLGRVLAREWVNKKINVNVLCPGYIETELTADWFKSEGGQRQIQRWPRRRLMEASSLDGLLLYLSSDASEFVTGSVFTVDDGQTL